MPTQLNWDTAQHRTGKITSIRPVSATELECTKCKLRLPVSMFYMRKRNQSYHSWCKDCQHSLYSKLSKIAKTAVLKKAAIRYRQNRSKIIRQVMEYQKKHSEQRRKYQSNWRKRNHKKVSLAWRHYLKRKLEIDPLFALKYKARLLVLAAFKRKNARKTSHTYEILGCSYVELSKSLGFRPSKNHVLDHICPLSQAKTEAEVLLLNNHKNLQWLTRKENAVKKDKPVPEAVAKCRELLGRDWQYQPGHSYITPLNSGIRRCIQESYAEAV